MQYMRYFHLYKNLIPEWWTWKYLFTLLFTVIFLVMVGFTKTRRFSENMTKMRTETDWDVPYHSQLIHDGMIVDRSMMKYRLRYRWRLPFWNLFIAIRDST